MTRKGPLAALLAVLLAAGALYLYLRRQELTFGGSAARSLVVVTRDVALGELISRSALDFRDLPERYVEERHIDAHDLERVVGTRSSTAVPGGSALLWSDLDLSIERRSLSSLVRAGKRAFTLPERDVSFDGLLCPGDRVDVLFTQATSDTRTLLQNVLVLTVGDDLGDLGEPRPLPGRRSGRVTLSVGLEQAERLAACEGRGTLRLALRNPQDLALVERSLPTPASPADDVLTPARAEVSLARGSARSDERAP
jgi:pilus assembly protein CpaB